MCAQSKLAMWLKDNHPSPTKVKDELLTSLKYLPAYYLIQIILPMTPYIITP